MKELELLQQRLEQLIRRFTALQAEKERMDKALARQAEIISGQQETINRLEQELQLKTVAGSVAGTASPAEKEQLKQHLDQVIREIEKNIELL